MQKCSNNFTGLIACLDGYCSITDVAMSSSGMTRKNYRMSRNLINNNNLMEGTNTAITYSLCYPPYFINLKNRTL